MPKRHEAIVQRIIADAHRTAMQTLQEARISHGSKYIVFLGVVPATKTWHCFMYDTAYDRSTDTITGSRESMLTKAFERAYECCAPLHVVINNITRVY